MPESQIIVNEKVIQEDMYYKGQVILTYTVKYPYFTSDTYYLALDKINSYYRTKAYMYLKSDIMKLYQMAMIQYEYSKANNFPLRQFEAVTIFVVTYNKDCALSIYFDRYEYTGGAHGSTIRTSDTWNVACSCPVDMASLFPLVYNVNDYVTAIIINQISQEAQLGDFVYFEDYDTLVLENFNPKNFYLTDKGIIIYYQQYDIAPYSTGIPEFLIPYSKEGAIRPRYC